MNIGPQNYVDLSPTEKKNHINSISKNQIGELKNAYEKKQGFVQKFNEYCQTPNRALNPKYVYSSQACDDYAHKDNMRRLSAEIKKNVDLVKANPNNCGKEDVYKYAQKECDDYYKKVLSGTKKVERDIKKAEYKDIVRAATIGKISGSDAEKEAAMLEYKTFCNTDEKLAANKAKCDANKKRRTSIEHNKLQRSAKNKEIEKKCLDRVTASWYKEMSKDISGANVSGEIDEEIFLDVLKEVFENLNVQNKASIFAKIVELTRIKKHRTTNDINTDNNNIKKHINDITVLTMSIYLYIVFFYVQLINYDKTKKFILNDDTYRKFRLLVSPDKLFQLINHKDMCKVMTCPIEDDTKCANNGTRDNFLSITLKMDKNTKFMLDTIKNHKLLKPV